MFKNRLTSLLAAVAVMLVCAQPSSAQTFGSPFSTVVPSMVFEGGMLAQLVEDEGQRATYRYAVAAFAPVATPTAFLVIQGSATKVVRIKEIRIGGVATAAGNMQLQLARWSTAGTPGSAVLTTLTAGKYDTNDGAATAVVSTVGTANYTTQGTGSTVPLTAARIPLAVVATGAPVLLTYAFSTRSDKPVTLRGTSDFIVLSGNGSAVPTGAAIDVEVELEEDSQ